MNIEGPAGVLEARYDTAPAGARAQAVLCHPHPLYGGSLHDAVLDCLTRTLLSAGIGVLRFNFRGVGGSAGRHDDGAGEGEDLKAAVRWIAARHPAQPLWLGGYSFGAWVAWRALMDGLSPRHVVLVAPPVGRLWFEPRAADCAVDVVVGDGDDFVDFRLLDAWPGITVHRLPGADHFFSGAMDTLADTCRAIVD